MKKYLFILLAAIAFVACIQADTIPWIMSESANGLDNLTNKDYPMIVYSTSCTITPFDVIEGLEEYPNIGQSLTLGKDYGGPALIGNTREGLVYTSTLYQLFFNDYIINRLNFRKLYILEVNEVREVIASLEVNDNRYEC